MMDFAELKALPGSEPEYHWLERRLETLSVMESVVLSAAFMRQPPETLGDVVQHLHSLQDYGVCYPAGSYHELGKYYFVHESNLPEEALPYVDLEQLGQHYEDIHPGLFIGSCFVTYPQHLPRQCFADSDKLLCADDGWSAKIKLASSAVPEGVWLRLPDYSAATDRPDEIDIALDALKVKKLEDCTVLEARCRIPQLGELMEQYEDAEELVIDGNDLGYILDEQGQGMPHFTERYAAALEYENCHDLRFALDIAQNLHCYEWFPADGLKDFGRRKLLEAGVSEDLLDSGCIDLENYASDLLGSAGYVLTGDERAYITRNNREFIYDRSTPEEAEMQMQ